MAFDRTADCFEESHQGWTFQGTQDQNQVSTYPYNNNPLWQFTADEIESIQSSQLSYDTPVLEKPPCRLLFVLKDGNSTMLNEQSIRDSLDRLGIVAQVQCVQPGCISDSSSPKFDLYCSEGSCSISELVKEPLGFTIEPCFGPLSPVRRIRYLKVQAYDALVRGLNLCTPD